MTEEDYYSYRETYSECYVDIRNKAKNALENSPSGTGLTGTPITSRYDAVIEGLKMSWRKIRGFFKNEK
ncbi:hypothetical protein CHISP_0558 [Chitinispirillum alkaliphilum]|nr:hypothetical protein CHISP_0558 [Chitinispirillum alkaliphilum]